MIGSTLSHYRILEKIGAGGMGVVYRAHDERLDRNVALKVLPGGLLSDEGARRRFRKEALALSRLNHPNIETVYDFDTEEGFDFLVMEYIPGETLAQKLAGGPVPEKEVAALGAQIVSALEGAHERGVVHRDLKPGNILVTGRGQAKVLDFGLAMLFRPEGDASQAETISQTYAAAGTLPYMAPEQLRGEKADPRSDIYAAGAVLFEMATRQRPFPQKSAPRLIDAIQHEAPPTPSTINRRISPALDGIILKALDKDPNRRYQSAREMLVDLERLGAPAPLRAARRPRAHAFWWAIAPTGALLAVVGVVVGLNVGGMRERFLGRAAPQRIESLAVLPLANLSGDPEQEYFADGMTEELITDLAKIGALRVISRTSIMHYKGTRKTVPEIGRELNVDAVVEGSVLRSGGRVRITAQLVEAATDRHIWAQSYERDLRDVLSLQSEISRAVVRQIQVVLAPDERARLAGARTVDPDAYQSYLQGRYQWNKRTAAGLTKAISQFEEAVARDPGFAPVYVGLADCYSSLPDYSGMRPEEAYPKARSALLKALSIDDTLAEAHASFASMLQSEWDWAGAEREYRRAINLNPGDAKAHHWYAMYLSSMGRHDDAITEIGRALQLDPVSPIINANVGLVYIQARQYEKAGEALRRALDLDPHFHVTRVRIGLLRALEGKFEESIAEFQTALSLTGGDLVEREWLGLAYGLAGRKADAGRILDEMKALAGRTHISPLIFAELYAAVGQKDQAFAWLERAYTSHDGGMIDLKVEPWLDPLRSDPRYQDLLRRVGLPPD